MKIKCFITVLSIMLVALSTNTISFATQPAENVINDLYKFKIIADTSNIRADDNLTRAEAIKMICIAEGNDLFDGQEANEQIFDDVSTSHWATKYIEIGFYDHIIQGYDDNTFRPDDAITCQELQKMLISVLGFDLYAQNAGGYPDGYLLYSKNLGITKNSNIDDKSYITRGDAMQMIYNSLDSPTMVVQRMFVGEVETDPIIKLYDGGEYPFKSLRMILSGEAEWT